MAFCNQCGHRLAEGSKFCSECGSPVVSNTTAEEINLDVEISMPVTLKGKPEESTTVEVFLAHLNKTLAIKVPNNIAPGQILRLRGSGYVAADGKKGDAYVRIVKIDYDNFTTKKQETARKTVYDGEIHKCPNCGDILDAYESVCESCGYERRGAKATSSVQELARKLESIESQRVPRRETSIFTQILTQGHISKTDEQKINLIQSFPIPNTKEDIMEFAVLAISNVDPDAFSTWNNPSIYNIASKQAISNAWLSKFEQAYQKGKLMFGDSPELENMHALYRAKKKSIMIKKNAIWIAYGIIFGVLGLIAGILVIAIG